MLFFHLERYKKCISHSAGVILCRPNIMQNMYFSKSNIGIGHSKFLILQCRCQIRGPVWECAGLSWGQSIRRIVLPQALRTAFPSLSNSLIAMVKDTSLASNITVTEMFMATTRIAARTWQYLPLYLEVGFIYLMFCTVLTKLQKVLI